MYVSVVNQYGRTDKINVRRVNYVLYERDTLFINYTDRLAPLTSDKVQAGFLITALLAETSSLDFREDGRGYLLNLAAVHHADADARAKTVFVNFATGTQVRVPIAKEAILGAALTAFQEEQYDPYGQATPDGHRHWQSSRWKRIRYTP
jgi:hypothetical protein